MKKGIIRDVSERDLTKVGAKHVVIERDTDPHLNPVDDMEKTVISDIRLFAIGDQWGAVAELEDGSEIPVWAVNGNDPSETPPWEKDERQYEAWYNRALDAAHEQGMFLEGEMDADISNKGRLS